MQFSLSFFSAYQCFKHNLATTQKHIPARQNICEFVDYLICSKWVNLLNLEKFSSSNDEKSERRKNEISKRINNTHKMVMVESIKLLFAYSFFLLLLLFDVSVLPTAHYSIHLAFRLSFYYHNFHKCVEEKEEVEEKVLCECVVYIQLAVYMHWMLIVWMHFNFTV